MYIKITYSHCIFSYIPATDYHILTESIATDKILKQGLLENRNECQCTQMCLFTCITHCSDL